MTTPNGTEQRTPLPTDNTTDNPPFITESLSFGSGERLNLGIASPVLSMDQLQQVLTTVLAMQQHKPMSPFERALNWTDTPKYPGKNDRVDAWFAAFEAKMKGAKIPIDRWGEKLCECPAFPSDIKQVMSEQNQLNYQAMRAFSLKQDGPTFPVGYFQHLIFAVRGDTAEEVLRVLQDRLVLHNRAARDAQEQQWNRKHLLFPFANAFQPETARVLRQQISLCLQAEDPLAELAGKAPSAADRRSAGNLPLIASIDAPESEAKKSSDQTALNLLNGTSATELIAALKVIGQGQKRSREQQTENFVKRTRHDVPQDNYRRVERTNETAEDNVRRCRNCGGTCTSWKDCFAYGKECFYCHGTNHLASCCQKKNAKYQKDTRGGRPFQQRGRP